VRILLILAVAVSGWTGEAVGAAKSETIDTFGYKGCIALDNGEARVVLGPHAGGRVLVYSLDGVSAIKLDPQQSGWTWDGASRVDLTGGRFDVGPEKVLPKRPVLWLGPWEGRITGEGTARMTSRPDSSTGLKLTRDFRLADTGSRLDVTQTMTNVSADTVHTCHWSRTFAPGHGIAVVPRSGPVRFPKGYIQYGPGPVMNFSPEDPAIRVDERFVTILDTPAQPKLGFDSHAGWLAYLMPNHMMFVKRFATYPDRAYNEMAALTISIWYKDDVVCELEPIGPMETLAPGASASFTETWYLLPQPFPADRRAVDAAEVARKVASATRR
jgi:hypothetical protein